MNFLAQADQLQEQQGSYSLPSNDELLQAILEATDGLSANLAGIGLTVEGFRAEDRCGYYNTARARFDVEQKKIDDSGLADKIGHLHIAVVSAKAGMDNLTSQNLGERPDIKTYLQQEKLLLESAATQPDSIDARNIIYFCCDVRSRCNAGIPEPIISEETKSMVATQMRVAFARNATPAPYLQLD